MGAHDNERCKKCGNLQVKMTEDADHQTWKCLGRFCGLEEKKDRPVDRALTYEIEALLRGETKE